VSSLENKVVLVTGAANGIGKDITKLIDRLGCKKIILVDIDQDGLNEVSRNLKTHSISFKVDLSKAVKENKDFLLSMKQEIVDIVICNAGLGGINPGDQYDEEINRKLMSVNFFGTTGILSLVLPSMLERKSGHIVGVASLAGLRGMPQAASYSASKAAQITFLESMRLDMKPYNIKVTTILPGFIKTKMADHNEFKMPFMLSSEKTAMKVISSIMRDKKTVYFPFPMNILSLLNKFLPVWLYDRVILLINPATKKNAKIF